MARRADPTPGHQRLLGLAAVAGLSVATALAFGRVFTGRQATLELVAAGLASVAIAALFERRGLLLATLASLVGLALAITWFVLPQTAWYGLPSIRTLRAIGRSLEFVGQQARVRVAPTPPLPPLMLAAVTAVWTAAFSSHALAIRAGSPLLAILPPVALVGFADTVLEDGARPIYAIMLLAAALAVVFADGLRRVRQWGPVGSARRLLDLGRRGRRAGSVHRDPRAAHRRRAGPRPVRGLDPRSPVPTDVHPR
jgi:TgpA N-terminal domain